MQDSVGLVFASVNVCLAIVIFLVGFSGVRYFKSGLIVRNIKRTLPSTVLLFLYFLTQAFIAIDLLPATTPIDDILGTLFMLTILYSAYAMINDWRTLAP